MLAIYTSSFAQDDCYYYIDIYLYEGDDITLSVDTLLPDSTVFTAVEYKWRIADEQIDFSQIFSISSVTMADSYSYTCKVTGIENGSNKIYHFCFDVFVNARGSGSLEGRFNPKELIIDFSNIENAAQVKMELNSLGMNAIDSCECGGIELWKADTLYIDIEETIKNSTVKVDEEEISSKLCDEFQNSKALH